MKGLLQTNTDGTTKLMDFLDEQRMCRLYEKFILEYYKKHYPKLTVSASHIPWALDDGIGDMLPVMQSDIHFGLDCLQASTSGWSSSSVSPISRAPIAFSAPTLPP